MKEIIITTFNFFADNIFVHIRFLFYPFYIALRALNSFSFFFTLLSNEFLKYQFLSCGKGVRLNGKMTIICPDKLFIGNNVHINNAAYIRACGSVRIHDNCHISRNLMLYSQNHNYEGDLLPYDSSFKNKPVIIEKNVWIGSNVKITPGVTIGEGAIIGMGSVVGQDVEPLCIMLSNGTKYFRNKEHYEKLDANKQYSGMSGYAYKNSE